MSIPLFVIGFTSVFTLMLISLTGETFALYLGAISLGVVVVSVFFKRAREDKTLILTMISVLVACALFLIKTDFYYKPALSFCGSAVEIKGQVIELEKKSESGANRYIIKVTEGPLKGYKIRLSSKYTECELCDYVSLKGKVYELGTEESKNYYKSRNLFIGTYTYGDVAVTSLEEKSFADRLRLKSSAISYYLEGELKRNLPTNYAETLYSMLIGDKSNLPEEIYESFQKTGIVHLLAVSGFHTTLWSMIVYRFFLKRGLGLRVSSALSILFILLFIGATGFSKSTIRAGIMIIVFFFGRMVSRQPDSKNSLGLSAIIITVLNPFVGGDTGFLLSFFSTLGILVIFPSLLKSVLNFEKRYIHNFIIRDKLNSLISVLLITISTLCFTFPLMMLFIGDMSLVSPITNLLTTTVASAAIFLSGVGTLLSKIPVLCAFEKPLLLASGLIIKYVLFISEGMAGWSYASISIENNFIFVTVSAILILIGFSLILKASKNRTFIFSTLIFVVSIITHYLVEYVELIN